MSGGRPPSTGCARLVDDVSGVIYLSEDEDDIAISSTSPSGVKAERDRLSSQSKSAAVFLVESDDETLQKEVEQVELSDESSDDVSVEIRTISNTAREVPGPADDAPSTETTHREEVLDLDRKKKETQSQDSTSQTPTTDTISGRKSVSISEADVREPEVSVSTQTEPSVAALITAPARVPTRSPRRLWTAKIGTRVSLNTPVQVFEVTDDEERPISRKRRKSTISAQSGPSTTVMDPPSSPKTATLRTGGETDQTTGNEGSEEELPATIDLNEPAISASDVSVTDALVTRPSDEKKASQDRSISAEAPTDSQATEPDVERGVTEAVQTCALDTSISRTPKEDPTGPEGSSERNSPINTEEITSDSGVWLPLPSPKASISILGLQRKPEERISLTSTCSSSSALPLDNVVHTEENNSEPEEGEINSDTSSVKVHSISPVTEADSPAESLPTLEGSPQESTGRTLQSLDQDDPFGFGLLRQGLRSGDEESVAVSTEDAFATPRSPIDSACQINGISGVSPAMPPGSEGIKTSDVQASESESGLTEVLQGDNEHNTLRTAPEGGTASSVDAASPEQQEMTPSTTAVEPADESEQSRPQSPTDVTGTVVDETDRPCDGDTGAATAICGDSPLNAEGSMETDDYRLDGVKPRATSEGEGKEKIRQPFYALSSSVGVEEAPPVGDLEGTPELLPSIPDQEQLESSDHSVQITPGDSESPMASSGEARTPSDAQTVRVEEVETAVESGAEVEDPSNQSSDAESTREPTPDSSETEKATQHPREESAQAEEQSSINDEDIVNGEKKTKKRVTWDANPPARKFMERYPAELEEEFDASVFIPSPRKKIRRNSISMAPSSDSAADTVGESIFDNLFKGSPEGGSPLPEDENARKDEVTDMSVQSAESEEDRTPKPTAEPIGTPSLPKQRRTAAQRTTRESPTESSEIRELETVGATVESSPLSSEPRNPADVIKWIDQSLKGTPMEMAKRSAGTGTPSLLTILDSVADRLEEKKDNPNKIITCLKRPRGEISEPFCQPLQRKPRVVGTEVSSTEVSSTEMSSTEISSTEISSTEVSAVVEGVSKESTTDVTPRPERGTGSTFSPKSTGGPWMDDVWVDVSDGSEWCNEPGGRGQLLEATLGRCQRERMRDSARVAVGVPVTVDWMCHTPMCTLVEK